MVKPLGWMAALGPLAWLLHGAFISGDLGADPVKTIQIVTGLSTLVLLFITLSITPLRRLTGLNELIRLRRLAGLFAFFYSVLHAVTYFVFDQSLDPGLIWEDTKDHPRIAVGFVAFLCLVPLAFTSTTGWIRRLGGRRWTQLHRLIYVSTALGILHYLMVQKIDLRTPLVYLGVFAALMLFRVRAGRARGPGKASRQSP